MCKCANSSKADIQLVEVRRDYKEKITLRHLLIKERHFTHIVSFPFR